MNYWLMKSEPDVFSIDDLKRMKIEGWEGVRNYQARNFMRDQMKKGDLAFFYHSSCAVPGITGVMTIHREAYPDPSALDPESEYYDPKGNEAAPRWYMVDVKYVKMLKRTISLQELKRHKALASMRLLQRGNRLSILPVTKKQWDYIVKLE